MRAPSITVIMREGGSTRVTDKRVAVAISGGGRTLSNLISGADGYQVVAVLSSSPRVKGNRLAQVHNLPLHVVEGEEDLAAFLLEQKVQVLALAGYLRKFPLLSEFEGKILNIHPSLLPKYGGKGMYGMNVHRAVHRAGERESGATVHLVTGEYDQGPILAQARVDVSSCKDPDEIAARVFQAECRLYPSVLASFCRDLSDLS